MVGSLITLLYYNLMFLFSMDDARYDFIMVLWLVTYYDFYDKKVLVLFKYHIPIGIFLVDCLSNPMRCHWEQETTTRRWVYLPYTVVS